jgi:hypothetical protein
MHALLRSSVGIASSAAPGAEGSLFDRKATASVAPRSGRHRPDLSPTLEPSRPAYRPCLAVRSHHGSKRDSTHPGRTPVSARPVLQTSRMPAYASYPCRWSPRVANTASPLTGGGQPRRGVPLSGRRRRRPHPSRARQRRRRQPQSRRHRHLQRDQRGNCRSKGQGRQPQAVMPSSILRSLSLMMAPSIEPSDLKPLYLGLVEGQLLDGL